MSDFERLSASVRDMAEQVRKVMKPDSDWEPTLIVVGRRPAVTPLITVDKEAWPAVAKQLVADTGATFAALIVTAWTIDYHATLDEGEDVEEKVAEVEAEVAAMGGVGNHPDRREAVIVECADRAGRTAKWTARITRSADGPPQLGPWEADTASDSRGLLAGLVADAFPAGGRA